jgi:hypothetical protein
MTPQKPLRWTVERFENGFAVLKEGGYEWRIPRSQVPKDAKEGDVLAAEFYYAKDEKLRHENIARALLEEILGKE